jgi:hypothetical protein
VAAIGGALISMFTRRTITAPTFLKEFDKNNAQLTELPKYCSISLTFSLNSYNFRIQFDHKQNLHPSQLFYAYPAIYWNNSHNTEQVVLLCWEYELLDEQANPVQ